jgi:hypothetical protein
LQADGRVVVTTEVKRVCELERKGRNEDSEEADLEVVTVERGSVDSIGV